MPGSRQNKGTGPTRCRHGSGGGSVLTAARRLASPGVIPALRRGGRQDGREGPRAVRQGLALARQSPLPGTVPPAAVAPMPSLP